MNRNFVNKNLALTFEHKLMNISRFFSTKKKKEERELIKQAYFFGDIIIEF